MLDYAVCKHSISDNLVSMKIDSSSQDSLHSEISYIVPRLGPSTTALGSNYTVPGLTLLHRGLKKIRYTFQDQFLDNNPFIKFKNLFY